MTKPTRIALAVSIVLLAVPSAANALSVQTSDASHPWQQWANNAQVPTWQGALPLTIAPSYVGCGGYGDADGCTSITPAVDQTSGQIIQGPPAEITTSVSDGDDPLATFYHELGQVFWAEYLTPADETRFMQIVGLSGDSSNWSNWAYHRTTNGVVLTFPPFEWFAEGYRLCATYGINQPAGTKSMEGLGYPGIEAWFATKQAQVCRFIDQVGLDNGIATPAQQQYVKQPSSKGTNATTKAQHHRRVRRTIHRARRHVLRSHPTPARKRRHAPTPKR